jgi:hypothetical protein
MRYAILLLLFSASAQAADPLLVARIVVCESSSPDVCGDDGVSCGIAQFRKETFYEFAKMDRLIFWLCVLVIAFYVMWVR